MSKKPRKNQLTIALSGASGRMGQAIFAVIEGDKEKKWHVGLALNKAADWRKASGKDIDVVIDFSTPEGLQQATAWAVEFGKPIVSGTTGLSRPQMQPLRWTRTSAPTS